MNGQGEGYQTGGGVTPLCFHFNFMPICHHELWPREFSLGPHQPPELNAWAMMGSGLFWAVYCAHVIDDQLMVFGISFLSSCWVWNRLCVMRGICFIDSWIYSMYKSSRVRFDFVLWGGKDWDSQTDKWSLVGLRFLNNFLNWLNLLSYCKFFKQPLKTRISCRRSLSSWIIAL